MRATPNPVLLSEAVQNLSFIGIKKGLLQSSKQFLLDSFISGQEAIEVLLQKTLLIGPANRENMTQLWSPWGTYVGAVGFLVAQEFTDARKWNRIWMMVLIEPFFDQMKDLLEEAKSLK